MPIEVLAYNSATKTLVPLPEWVAIWEAQGRSQGSATDAYTGSAWAQRAISIRADAVTVAPLRLYGKDGKEITRHPILDLLETVNDEWNKADLWRFTESALCVYNFATWQKVGGGQGRPPKELFFLNPSTMRVDLGAGQDQGTARGIAGFVQGSSTKFARDEVVYFRGAYDPKNDLVGIALLSFAALAAISEKNADKFLSAFFANGAVPPLVFTSDQAVPDSEIQRWVAWWRKLFGGVGRQHQTGFVGGGLKPVQLGSNLKDLALTDVRTSIHQTICAVLGVPELLISPTLAADKTPMKLAEEVLYKTTILPRWVYYEETLNSELLTDFPDLVATGAKLKFDISNVAALQEDKDSRVKRSVSMWEKRMLTLDQALVMAGENPVGGVDGASRYVVTTIRDQQALSQEGELEQGQAAGPNPQVIKELDQWKRKALKNIGKPFDFDTEYVSDELALKVEAGLKEAKNVADVRAVFDEAKKAIQPSKAQLTFEAIQSALAFRTRNRAAV